MDKGSYASLSVAETTTLNSIFARYLDEEVPKKKSIADHNFGKSSSAHIDVDARAGLTHSVSTTTVNANDVTETARRVKRCQSRLVDCRHF
jgi:pyrroloquinoline quinone (PQQ) biosynthesis protein C